MLNIQDIVKNIKGQEIVIKPIKDLIPYAKNSRKHSEEQINRVASSINAFGFVNPVLIRKDNTIIAGHCRILSAQKLGLKEIPCIELELNETEARAYVIADNQLASLSEWDGEMLNLELTALKESDFDISLTGFDEIPGFQFEAPNEEEKEEGEKKFSLQVKFENEDEQQLLFFELRDRGYKVKS